MHSEAVMRLDIMHPHRTQDDIATCPRRYLNLDGKVIPGEIAPMAQYRRFAKGIASMVCEELVV